MMSNKHLFSTNGGQPPLALAVEESKYASATDPPLSTSAQGATNSNGLDLLFAASQVETKPAERADADVKADSAEEVPSTITVVSNGTAHGGTAEEAESDSARNGDEEEGPSVGHDETKKPTIDGALKDQKVKTFPQVLHDILNTPEYESIAHWLPDGLSFIIADKQRFSNEVLPKYFRRALFHSFIRKLNRYGFRRVKGSCKGEESSFAHNNFVRDKPLLCLKMSCKSKPSFSYHKALRRPQQTAATTSIAMTGNIVAPAPDVLPPGFFVGARGMLDSGSSMFATTPLLPAATIGPPTTNATIAAAAAIEERQIVASMLADHYSQQKHQSVLRERQMHMLQMRRRQAQLQLELLRLREKSAYDGGHTPGSYDSYIQSCMMAQSHDMLPRNFFH